jgi:hypothetical protein
MITRNAIIVCILLIGSFTALAEKPRVKGYYVTMEGDTVEGLVEVAVNPFNKKKISEPSFFFGITFIDKNKEIKLGEDDVQAFGFVYLREHYDFRFVTEIQVPLLGHLNAKGTFLHLLVAGNCDLYAASADGGSDDYFFKRGQGDNYLLKNTSGILSHDKELARFFKDCPDLASKIKDKYFNGDDKYLRIAKFYNTRCQAGQAEE